MLELDPESEKNPFLPKAGWYGVGQENGGEAKVFGLEAPLERNPKFDEDGKRGPWSEWTVQVTTEDGVCFTRCLQSMAPNSGSKNIKFLNNLGIPCEMVEGADGRERPVYDETAIPGTPCAVKVKDPRTHEGVTYTGSFIDLVGA